MAESMTPESASRRLTQYQRIVLHLADLGGSISVRSAIDNRRLTCWKLSARIAEMTARTGIAPKKDIEDTDHRTIRYRYTAEQVAELRKYYKV